MIGALLALNAVPGIGPLRMARALELARTRGLAIDQLDGALLRQVDGIGAKAATTFDRLRRERFADRERERLDQIGGRLLCFDDDDYPSLLRELPDPPPVLYVKGDLPPDRPHLAIVGSRKCSDYGRDQARQFAWILASQGVIITSGLAQGVDGAAHRGALAGLGRTVAVMGCGIDRVYPGQHERLARQIQDGGGALISEYPLGAPPLPGHFPRRNRIIVGLSAGVLIVEAAPKSGTLTTARLACESNREVLALPGPVDCPGSAGPHALIRDGALLVTRPGDVTDALPQLEPPLGEAAGALPPDAETARADASADAQTGAGLASEVQRAQRARLEALLAALDYRPRNLHHLMRESGLSLSDTLTALGLLALANRVDEHPGQRYSLVHR